jgi:transcriptional regulator with XRE-family HTH domain
MAQDLPNYFKTCRMRAGLSQTELGELLGLKSGELISRIERREREPNLRTIIFYQIIFNISPKKLMPGIYKEIRKTIFSKIDRDRLDKIRRLASDDSSSSLRKFRSVFEIRHNSYEKQG